MERKTIVQLHNSFEKIANIEEPTGTEFWLARDLQYLLGYSRWENFQRTIVKAAESCKNAGSDPLDHFRDVTKMVQLGSGTAREIVDFALTRYACYLIAQNGDPSKDPIAFAQTYFAIQTRKQELIEDRIAEIERLHARKKLTQSEKELSHIIYQRLGSGQSVGRIRSKGDNALFGGKTTQEMKSQLQIPKGRALADYLPTITIKAKDFANEITTFNIAKDDLKSEPAITSEHVGNNRDVRQLLADRGIKPEELPPAEDIKKVERRVNSQTKKLPKNTDKLGG